MKRAKYAILIATLISYVINKKKDIVKDQIFLTIATINEIKTSKLPKKPFNNIVSFNKKKANINVVIGSNNNKIPTLSGLATF